MQRWEVEDGRKKQVPRYRQVQAEREDTARASEYPQHKDVYVRWFLHLATTFTG
jgi:hypothetical protein